MIVANIDQNRRKVTLISVPRDLYYNYRKVNMIHSLYGMEELKRTLGFVTGFEIDNALLIDMYAFIDVIDMIGGIDVHLDQPVIDPTYKTFDGGKWGTMYFRAGDHHLNGRQALRLARSRHTSSDFARSERQHMILSAVRDKFRAFGLGDASALRLMISDLLSKIDSDLNLADMISHYFRYQGYEIQGSYVLSTGNVLDWSYTNDKAYQEAGCPAPEGADEELKKKCATFERGQYILTPKNEDWNAIRWYVRQAINS